MDQRDEHLQTLGICTKLYNFIKKTLLVHALKSVTLGDPLHNNLFKAQNKANSRAQQETQRQCIGQANNMQNSNNSVNINNEKFDTDSIPGKRVEEEVAVRSAEAKPPKKAVSINERVEEIETSKKKITRKKSKENLGSFEKEEKEELKPLKSILKVGSYTGENTPIHG